MTTTPSPTNGKRSHSSYEDAEREYIQSESESATPRPSGPLTERLSRADAAWLTAPPPEREYLLRDVRAGGRGALVARGVVLLIAAGGAGKSFALVALALAVATGGTWLGALTARRGRVLVISGEEPADEIRRRVYWCARSLAIGEIDPGSIDVLDLHDVPAALCDGSGPTRLHGAIAEMVRARGPYALVIVDPLGRLAGVSIDADNAAAAAVIGALEALASVAKGLVIAAHHTSLTARRSGDAGATASRGATGLGDFARGVLSLVEEQVSHGDADLDAALGQIITVRLAKVNHVRKWDPIELRRGEQGELVPLDASDRAQVAEARRASDGRARREAERTDARRERDDADDAAARAVIAAHPGKPQRQLVAHVRRARSCGTDRAHAAVVRALAAERASS